ncbi:MAG: hypothetical protein MPN21_09515 [Thermoanaerobaculia bacterium]|nr:hypothetical protein [Thermoanaerobaculia bacterium]
MCTRRVSWASCLALLAAAGGAQTNPTLLDLPSGWTELAGSDMASAGWPLVPDCDYGAPCEIASGGIIAYSGAALDSERRRIVLWGGGHNDFFGNQLLLFDLLQLQWQVEQPPTSILQYELDEQGEAVSAYKFMNGLPVSRHTYDHIGIIDHLGGVLFSFSGACADAPLYNAGSSFGDVWTYDFVAGAWTDHTPFVTGGQDFYLTEPGASGEYDPVTERWYHLTAEGIWSYDFESRNWARITESGHPGIERSSVLDTARRKIWSYGGDYGGDATLSAFDIDDGVFEIVSFDNPPGVRSAAGLTYDPISDRLVLFGGSSDSSIWTYDPESMTWAEHTEAGGPPGSAVYSRFLYDPIHDLFLLVHSPESVWVWKRAAPGVIFADGFESGNTEAWTGSMP